MNNKFMKKICRLLRYNLILFSAILFMLGTINNYFNVTLISIMFLFVNNIIYGLEKKTNRMLFLIFNVMIFVFLLSRPFISMIKGDVWWYFKRNDVIFAMNSLMLTLLFLMFGQYIGEKSIYQKKLRINKFTIFDKYDYNYVKGLRCISICLFYISMVFFLLTELEKLIYMRGKDYEMLYSSFQTNLPYFIIAIGSMQKYFLCIFLSTFPKKLEAFIPLSLYVISALPSLIIGLRNPIVLNLIFCIVYYFIRDIYDNKEKWIGKMEKTIMIIAAPICILFLGAYNYIRAGEKIGGNGILDLFIDFLYKQGVSFDVLCIGHNTIPKIKYTGFVNYTFGGIIDYFTHNKIAQLIFNAKSLGSGNNINMALYSNSFAHRMSYAARGQEYLAGNGWGSSYILETYADFGYIGIIIFSVLIGVLLAYMIYLVNKGLFHSTIIFLILTNIFFLPRDAALNWINFIFYIQFLLPLIICFLFAKLCIKKYCYNIKVMESKY